MDFLRKLGRIIEPHILKAFDIFCLILFDTFVCAAAFVCVFAVLFPFNTLFSEKERFVEIIKIVSGACVVGAYAVYVIADLFFYIKKIWKGPFDGS